MSLLQSISRGVVRLPPRIVLLGGEKRGKSTLAAQFPAPIFLPIAGETGADEIDVPKFPTLAAYRGVLDSLEALALEEHEFSTVVIDSLSALEPIVNDHALTTERKKSISQLGGGYGAQEAALGDYWRMMLCRLDWLRENKGMGVVLIGHVKPTPKTVSDPMADSYDTWRVELRESVLGFVNRWADSILFLDIKKYIRKAEGGAAPTRVARTAGERVLYTQWEPGHPGGGRGVYGHLPLEIEATYAAFAAAVEAARATGPAV